MELSQNRELMKLWVPFAYGAAWNLPFLGIYLFSDVLRLRDLLILESFGLVLVAVLLWAALRQRWEIKRQKRLVETGSCYDAKVLSWRFCYSESNAKGRSPFIVTCAYTDGSGKGCWADSRPVYWDAAPSYGSIAPATLFEGILALIFYAWQKKRADSEGIPVDRLSAMLWVNPANEKDYYVQVLYHPPEEAEDPRNWHEGRNDA